MNAPDSQSKPEKKDEHVSFDMYRLFSRWDVLLLVAFIIAFLIFATAIFLYPSVA